MSKEYLSKKQIKNIENYFANPNLKFFQKLDSITMTGKKTVPFVLKRLNNGIKTDTAFYFSVPTRKYAKMIRNKYGNLDKDCVWSDLAKNGNTLFENLPQKIPREYVIALAFVFRLSSEELNELLKASGHYILYGRSIIDSILQFVLDTFKASDEYKVFTDETILLSDERFIDNYIYFTELVAKYNPKIDTQKSKLVDSVVQCVNTKKEYKTKYKTKTDKTRTRWTINYENLRETVSKDNYPTNNLTGNCVSQLIEVCNHSKWRDDSYFEAYINENIYAFITNRERSYRYVLDMITDYQDNNLQSIDVTSFIKRFTEFTYHLNIRKENVSFSEKIFRQFKSFLSGKSDISRVYFIWLYLFTKTNKNTSLIPAEEIIKDLDDKLKSAGFEGVSNYNLEGFVTRFFELNSENTDRNKYFLNVFGDYIEKFGKEGNIAKYHLQTSSLISEEYLLLPYAIKKDDNND